MRQHDVIGSRARGEGVAQAEQERGLVVADAADGVFAGAGVEVGAEGAGVADVGDVAGGWWSWFWSRVGGRGEGLVGGGIVGGVVGGGGG